MAEECWNILLPVYYVSLPNHCLGAELVLNVKSVRWRDKDTVLDSHFCFALSKLVTKSAKLLGNLGSAEPEG